MKRTILLCSVLVVGALAATAAAAPISAVSVNDPNYGVYSGGGRPTSYQPGWKFIPTVDIWVSALGVYVQDDNFSSPMLHGVLTGSHSVKIWEHGNSTTPVASAVVAATKDPVEDVSSYTYSAIAPVHLTGGTTYYLMASIICPTGSNAYDGGGNPYVLASDTALDNMPGQGVGFTYGSEVGYVRGVYRNTGGTGEALYPDGFDGDPGFYLFGNFQYTPEPATMVLLAMGGLALLRRRNRA